MDTLAVLLVNTDGRIERANEPAREWLRARVGGRCRDAVGVRDELRGIGCTMTCTRELATSEGDRTRLAVGDLRGRPHRVSCAALGDLVVVTVSPVGELPLTAERLTPRELEVMELVAEGLSSTRIARRLGIGLSTVRTHVEHVREKTGARTRAEAVARVTAAGLLRND